MKNLLHRLLAACRPAAIGAGLFGAAVAASAASTAEIGHPAPDFSLQDIDGQTHRLSDYSGKVVVLEWNNPDCPIVHKHYDTGNLPGMQHAAMAKGVVWLLINSGGPGKEGGDYTADQIKAWLAQRHSKPTAYLRDPTGKIGHAYGAKATPQVYVINANGILVYDGAVDNYRTSDPADIPKAENYVKEALAAVYAGEPVAKPRSRPFGCSVKYASAD